MRHNSPGPYRLSITSIVLLAAALLYGCGSSMLGTASSLFGLRLGMDAHSALQTLGIDDDQLASLPYITGKKILHDTVALTRCELRFRRSFGFDSTQRLRVIGLTHKTPNPILARDRDCSKKWLVDQFGEPFEESMRDSVRVSAWNVAGAKLTLEAKSYDDNYGFVLIYLYPDSPSLTSVR